MHTPQGWFFTGIQAHVWPWFMGLFCPQALLYTNLTFPGWNTATAWPHSKMWTYRCRWWFTLALQLHPTKAHKLAETEQETRNPTHQGWILSICFPYKNPSKYQEGLSAQMKGSFICLVLCSLLITLWNKTQHRKFAYFVCGTKMVRIGPPWNYLPNVLTTCTSSWGVREAAKGIASKLD
jgi:hypothetical protein